MLTIRMLLKDKVYNTNLPR